MHELIFWIAILAKTRLICETSWNRHCFGSLILSNLRQRIIVQFWSPLMYFLWLYSVSSHIGGLTKPICSEKSNWVNPSNFATKQVKIDSSTINSWFDTRASKPILPIVFFSKVCLQLCIVAAEFRHQRFCNLWSVVGALTFNGISSELLDSSHLNKSNRSTKT